jgi:hypothetical protein
LLIFYNPIFLILVNSVFLSIAASFCRIRVAYLPFIFALPFFIVNSLLPNKEILSLLLSIIFFFAISKKRLGVAFVISLIIVFVRDGMGYAFVLVAILLHFRLLNRIAIIFILSFLVIIDFYLIEIQSHFELFVLQRTIGFFEMENIEWQPYYIRIFANSTNLISRVPIFTSDGWVSITGISLFLAGFSVFIATVLSLITCVRQSKTPNSQIVSSYAFLFILFITSLSPLIQPRYMIPVSLGYLFGCRIIDKTKKYIIILSLAALFPLRIAYGYLNSLPEATNFWPAGFFL